MSYTVKITSTSTTTSNAILLNYGYFKTIPGLLKLAELILGVVTVGLLGHYSTSAFNYFLGNAYLFFLLMATTFMICTFCLLLSCVLSWGTSSLISKTMFELIYHAVATILLLAASITFIVKIKDLHYGNRTVYDAYMAASIIGLINGVLYLLSAIFAHRQYKGI